MALEGMRGQRHALAALYSRERPGPSVEGECNLDNFTGVESLAWTWDKILM